MYWKPAISNIELNSFFKSKINFFRMNKDVIFELIIEIQYKIMMTIYEQLFSLNKLVYL